MMEFLLTIFGFCLIGLGVGLMFGNKKPETKKPWKPKKKNWFIRLSESGNPKYNWMGGYTESQ